MTGRIGIKHSIVPFFDFIYSFIQRVCAVHLLCIPETFPGTGTAAVKTDTVLALPRSWHSWRACRVRRQTHELKRLIDDAREWNWVTCYDREMDQRPVSLSSSVSADTWEEVKRMLAIQLWRKPAPGNKDNGCTGPDWGFSSLVKWPLFSVNYWPNCCLFHP